MGTSELADFLEQNFSKKLIQNYLPVKIRA